jgi:Leucine-rich repeat (LRR) protein
MSIKTSLFEQPKQHEMVPLDMSKRQLNQFVFPVLPHLVTHLYLNHNKLQTLPSDFFKQFFNLQWLDLRNNCLTELPSVLPRQFR